MKVYSSAAVSVNVLFESKRDANLIAQETEMIENCSATVSDSSSSV